MANEIYSNLYKTNAVHASFKATIGDRDEEEIAFAFHYLREVKVTRAIPLIKVFPSFTLNIIL